MTVSTEAIVISSIKYGDHSLIVKCFTKAEGTKSYLLRGILSSSKRKKIKPAHFQPLAAVQLIAIHNDKGNLNTIKEVQIINNYTSIYSEVVKQTIALFISEVLNQVLTEEENEQLFRFLETSILWLDHHTKTANFHLLFLVQLTKYLGFYPETTSIEQTYFNMVEGNFSANKPTVNHVSGQDLSLFKQLLGTNFDDIDKINLNHNNRQELLSIIIQYYELHLSGFRKPKSLEVLKAVFG